MKTTGKLSGACYVNVNSAPRIHGDVDKQINKVGNGQQFTTGVMRVRNDSDLKLITPYARYARGRRLACDEIRQ